MSAPIIIQSSGRGGYSGGVGRPYRRRSYRRKYRMSYRRRAFLRRMRFYRRRATTRADGSRGVTSANSGLFHMNANPMSGGGTVGFVSSRPGGSNLNYGY